MARLVEDWASATWEYISKARTSAHKKAWRLLTKRSNFSPIPLKIDPYTAVEDLKNIQDRFERVARDRGFKVEKVAPDKYRLAHKLPLFPVSAKEVRVDLKWSLWIANKESWQDYAPGIVRQMEKAFLGIGRPVLVRTAPRKEIRFGEVLITKGRATGTFACEWDEAHELADTLGTENNEAFVECLPGSAYVGGIGVDVEFVVAARTFNALMERIDAEEDRLIKLDRQEWKGIETLFHKE